MILRFAKKHHSMAAGIDHVVFYRTLLSGGGTVFGEVRPEYARCRFTCPFTPLSAKKG